MTIKSRAALLAGGILAFLIIAPAAILLARGYYFDFATRRLIKTGVLVVKTDPKNASVFLNGKKLADSTPLTKRFLAPGEYVLEIKKQSYRLWKKQVSLREQTITLLPPSGPEKIPLWLETPETQILSTTTKDFFTSGDQFFSLRPQGIFSANLNTPAEINLASTSTADFASATLVPTDSRNYPKEYGFLFSEGGSYRFATGQTTIDLPGNINSLEFDPRNNALFGLDPNQQLVRFDKNGKSEILRGSVQSFNAQNGLYYISTAPAPQLLQILQSGPDQLILKSLPPVNQSRIIVSPDKQIFLLLDDKLYQVGENLQKINERVQYAYWNENFHGLVYGNEHEVWLYPVERQESEFVTRSSQILGPGIYNVKTGYVFVAQGRELKAIEFDPLGQPNVYTLAETKNPYPKFAVNEEGTQLIYLDGGLLVSLRIR